MEKTHEDNDDDDDDDFDDNDGGTKTKDFCDERTKPNQFQPKCTTKMRKKNKNHSQIYEIEFGILLYETSVTE